MASPTVALDPHSISQGSVQAVSDLVFGTPTGDAVTITSAGSNFPVLIDKEFFEIRDHPSTQNNGLFQVDAAAPTTASIPCRKVSGADPVVDATLRPVNFLCTLATNITDGVWANAATDTVDITSVGGLPADIDIGSRFQVRNHSTSGNNGCYQALTTVSNGFNCRKLTGINPVNAASEAVDIDTERKSIFYDTAALGLYIVEQPGLVTDNVADAQWLNAAAPLIDIDSAGVNLPTVKIGQKFLVTNHATGANNGTYVVRGITTVGGNWQVEMVDDGKTPANAAAEAVDIQTDPWVDDTGVLGQPLYSRSMIDWKDDNFLIKNAAFPMLNIDSDAGKYLLGQDASGNNSGWNFVDNTEFGIRSRKLVRNMGWQEIDSVGLVTAEYAAIRSNASVEDNDRDLAYFQFGTDTTVDDTVDFEFAGPVDEAVKVFDATVTRAVVTPNGYDFNNVSPDTIDRNDGGDFIADGYKVGGRVTVANAEAPADDDTYLITVVTAGVMTVTALDGSDAGLTGGIDDNTATLDLDNRFAFSLKLRPRDDDTNGKSFAQQGLADALATQLSNRAFIFGLGTVEDADITNTDATVSAYGVTITFEATPQSKGAASLVGGARNFGIIVDGNNRTRNEIYEAVQRLLRQLTDIDSDADTNIGRTIDGLLRFNGNVLEFGSVDGGLSFPINPDGGGSGVFCDNVAAADTNFVKFWDNLGVLRSNKQTIAVTLDFNQILIDDTIAEGDLFFDRTIRSTVADLIITAGSPDTFNSAGANLPVLDVGANAYVRISGLTGGDAAMNGIYQVIAETSTTIWDVIRYDGVAIVSTSSASVSLDEHPFDTPDALIIDTTNLIDDTTISFTAPDTIDDTGSGFGIFSINDRLRIAGAGAGANAGKIVKVAAVSATQITVDQGQFEPVLVTQAAGGQVILTQMFSIEATADFADNFGFDDNVQGGRTISTTTLVKAKALGRVTAQYTESAVLSIVSGTPLTVPLQSQTERNVVL